MADSEKEKGNEAIVKVANTVEASALRVISCCALETVDSLTEGIWFQSFPVRRHHQHFLCLKFRLHEAFYSKDFSEAEATGSDEGLEVRSCA